MTLICVASTNRSPPSRFAHFLFVIPVVFQVVILNETHLQNRVEAEMTALQQSPESLVVQPRGFENGEIRRGSKVKSIAKSPS